jgi:L-aspartate oxidase
LAARGAEAFPQALAACRAAGLDPFETPVPVTPAAHFHMGGVVTDARGRASLPGLWACGEVAATGVHGANRLASNALLEALVFGERVARDAAQYQAPAGAAPPAIPRLGNPMTAVAARLRVRQIVGRALGLERDGLALAQADELLASFDRDIDDSAPLSAAASARLAGVRAWSETRNLILVARLVAHAARLREESRGAHVRHDYPRIQTQWARRIVLTEADLPRRDGVAAVVHDAA